MKKSNQAAMVWHRRTRFTFPLTNLLLLLLITLSASAEKLPLYNISGRIITEDGSVLQGISITVKGSSKATISGENGEFILKDIDKNDVLVLTSIGYETKEIAIAGRTHLEITLKIQVNSLEETVVIGYGTAKRQTLTGSVVKVGARDIEKQPVANPLQALQGRTAGVFINSNSGISGSDISVQIRGVNSVAAGSAPLYVIDGVPVASVSISKVYGASGYISPLSTINPSDIESIEILKDADATAIYGSRAANGVLLITTKKGKAGKTKLDVDFYSGASKVTRFIDFLDTKQYLALRRKAFANDGIIPDADNAPDLLLWDSTQYTDWQRLLLGNTASLTNAQATISGGDERTRFLLGAGFHQEGTVLIGDGYQKRGNVHLNVEHNSIDKKFSLSTTLTYGNDNISTIGSDPYWSITAPPNMPVYDSTGNKPYWLGGTTDADNPVSYKYSGAKTKSDNFIGNASVRYKLLPSLDLKLDLGYTKLTQRQHSEYPSTALNPNYNYGYKNYAYFANSYSQTYSIEPQINYGINIGRGKLTALLGSTFQTNVSGSDYLTALNFSTDALLGSLGAAGSISSKSTTYAEYKYESVFGRVNYDWDGKYIVNGVYRRDGSSRFGPGKRFGNFWSVGGAWIFTKEGFIQQALPFVSFGKLRGSYGVTGNDQIGNYQYLQTYTSTTYPYQGSAGLYPNRLANPDYSWEINKKLEFAAELGFLKNRISVTAAWYQNRSSNQLVSYPLASQTGFTSYQANLQALVENKGWEFELSTKNIVSKDFQWTTTFNITLAKNKLLKFPKLSSSAYANTYVIGESLNIFKLYHYTGVNPDNGVPEVEDVDKDGIASYPNDYINAGTSDPKYYGGIGNSFSYKGLTLDVFFQFQKQLGYGYLWTFYQPPGFMYNVSTKYATNYWEAAGHAATNPGLTSTSGSEIYDAYYNYYTFADATLSDASFIRLKTLSLSYTIPAKQSRKAGFDNIRIFVQGQNLLTFTHYDGLDPETQTATPPLKTITAGIHFTL